MKFCRNCGAQIDDNAIFCHNCGSRTNGDSPNNAYGFDPYNTRGFYNVDTRESLPVAILSFCFWQIGLVLWLMWRNARPGKARSAIKGTLSATCFQFPIAGLVLWLLWRRDPENKDYAKVGAISAIVGAALALLASLALLALSRSGLLVMPDMSSDIFSGIGAMFTHLGNFR